MSEEIDELGEDISLTLRMAYMHAWRFNGIVDWDMVKDPLPSGVTLEILMDDQALHTKISLIIAEKKLSSYLAG